MGKFRISLVEVMIILSVIGLLVTVLCSNLSIKDEGTKIDTKNKYYNIRKSE